MIDLSPIAPYQQQVTSFMTALPDEVLRGNVFAIVIFLILLYIAIYLIQKFTTLLVSVLKKVFLLIIVILAFYEFLRVFALRIIGEGMTADTLLFGAAGVTIGCLALFTALYVAFRSIIRLQKEAEAAAESPPAPEENVQSSPSPLATPAEEETTIAEPEDKRPETAENGTKERSLPVQVKEELSFGALRNDKRIGAVIAYIIIAEFGVFSSKTIAAPTIQAGLMFFLAFLLASTVFIRLTYHDYWRGLRHLAAALLIGGILSLILGYFWGGIPLVQLLSPSYFASDALVALITGLALSLFMGSMN